MAARYTKSSTQLECGQIANLAKMCGTMQVSPHAVGLNRGNANDNVGSNVEEALLEALVAPRPRSEPSAESLVAYDSYASAGVTYPAVWLSARAPRRLLGPSFSPPTGVCWGIYCLSWIQMRQSSGVRVHSGSASTNHPIKAI